MDSLTLQLQHYRQRSYQHIVQKMANLALDAFIVTELPIIRWLTGFSGSSARLLITREKVWLFTDFRYQEQVRHEVTLAETVIVAEGFIAELLSGNYPCGTTIALQAEHITWQEANRLRDKVFHAQQVMPIEGFFNEFRIIKQAVELDYMQRAAALSEAALEAVLPMISPNVTELDIAAELSYQQKKRGASGDSFSPIVASGARAAMPHATPTNAHFVQGELILLDFGCMYEGYASDQTRTVALGKPSKQASTIYNIVRKAQQLGLERAQCGMKARKLDEVVRRFITKHGYGEQFGHALGHGIGLEVHEEPRISSRSETILQEMMLFTIEPGIYLPNCCGVRIEDTVVMGTQGAMPLQQFSKELIVL